MYFAEKETTAGVSWYYPKWTLLLPAKQNAGVYTRISRYIERMRSVVVTEVMLISLLSLFLIDLNSETSTR
jgi:hypothetical protein